MERQAKLKVIVIGAGVSGLTTATELKKSGLVDVLVLEAQDRLGGRTWTFDLPESPNGENKNPVPIDMGAAWIHGVTGNPLIARAVEAGASFHDFGEENLIPPIFDADGNSITDAQKVLPENLFEKLNEYIVEMKPVLKKEGRDFSLKEAVKKMCENDVQFSDCWNSLGAEGQLLQWLVGSVESFYACPPSDLSVAYYDDWKMLPGGDYLMKSGYSTLVRHLASLLSPFEWRLSSPIKAIDWSSSSSSGRRQRRQITVTTERGEEFVADVVVVTVSLGVLKSKTIQFQPQLPPFKLGAIEKMGFGLMDKVVLRFPRVFWHSCANDLYLGTTDPTEQFRWWVNCNPICQEPILVCLVVSHFAYQIEDITLKSGDQVVVDRAMKVLRACFEKENVGLGGVPDPTNSYITKWSANPYTRGSYSYVSVGSDGPAAFDDLAAPLADGHLRFAGEATYFDYQGCVHAAYESGIRESSLILQNLGDLAQLSHKL